MCLSSLCLFCPVQHGCLVDDCLEIKIDYVTRRCRLRRVMVVEATGESGREAQSENDGAQTQRRHRHLEYSICHGHRGCANAVHVHHPPIYETSGRTGVSDLHGICDNACLRRRSGAMRRHMDVVCNASLC